MFHTSMHSYLSSRKKFGICQVVNKTRNGTEWKMLMTTHPWTTELHPRKLFVHARAEREASGQVCSLIQLETVGKQTTPYQRILELQQLSTMMMMTMQLVLQCITCCSPQVDCSSFWQLSIEEPSLPVIIIPWKC